MAQDSGNPQDIAVESPQADNPSASNTAPPNPYGIALPEGFELDIFDIAEGGRFSPEARVETNPAFDISQISRFEIDSLRELDETITGSNEWQSKLQHLIKAGMGTFIAGVSGASRRGGGIEEDIACTDALLRYLIYQQLLEDYLAQLEQELQDILAEIDKTEDQLENAINERQDLDTELERLQNDNLLIEQQYPDIDFKDQEDFQRRLERGELTISERRAYEQWLQNSARIELIEARIDVLDNEIVTLANKYDRLREQLGEKGEQFERLSGEKLNMHTGGLAHGVRNYIEVTEARKALGDNNASVQIDGRDQLVYVDAQGQYHALLLDGTSLELGQEQIEHQIQNGQNVLTESEIRDYRDILLERNEEFAGITRESQAEDLRIARENLQNAENTLAKSLEERDDLQEQINQIENELSELYDSNMIAYHDGSAFDTIFADGQWHLKADYYSEQIDQLNAQLDDLYEARISLDAALEISRQNVDIARNYTSYMEAIDENFEVLSENYRLLSLGLISLDEFNLRNAEVEGINEAFQAAYSSEEFMNTLLTQGAAAGLSEEQISMVVASMQAAQEDLAQARADLAALDEAKAMITKILEENPETTRLSFLTEHYNVYNGYAPEFAPVLAQGPGSITEAFADPVEINGHTIFSDPATDDVSQKFYYMEGEQRIYVTDDRQVADILKQAWGEPPKLYGNEVGPEFFGGMQAQDDSPADQLYVCDHMMQCTMLEIEQLETTVDVLDSRLEMMGINSQSDLPRSEPAAELSHSAEMVNCDTQTDAETDSDAVAPEANEESLAENEGALDENEVGAFTHEYDGWTLPATIENLIQSALDGAYIDGAALDLVMEDFAGMEDKILRELARQGIQVNDLQDSTQPKVIATGNAPVIFGGDPEVKMCKIADFNPEGIPVFEGPTTLSYASQLDAENEETSPSALSNAFTQATTSPEPSTQADPNLSLTTQPALTNNDFTA